MPTGAALVVDALLAAGVEQLFTLSGNQILSVYDAAIGTPLALYHTRHEASAVHMADAVARLTDRPGVALVTAGPGHLNALSALYGALMEESPVVLLSGASPRGQRGLGAFQEIDQAAAARPVTKAAWVAEDAARLGDDMARALEIAVSGRPGPVHLSLPGDLLEASVSGTAPAVPSAPARVATSETLVSQMLALLAEAKRPVIIAGAGMARGPRWLGVQRLARSVAAPALPSGSPRGVNDPWLRGANACLARADVVVLLGKPLDFSLRFGRSPAFAADCRFVHVTAEPAPPNARVTLTVVADPTTVAEQLASAARGRTWPETGWADEVTRVRAATPPAWQTLRESPRTPMHPLAVCAALQPLVDGGACWSSTAASSASGCRPEWTRRGGSSTARPDRSAARFRWPSPPGSFIEIVRSSRRSAMGPSAFIRSSSTLRSATGCRSSPSSATTRAGTPSTSSSSSTTAPSVPSPARCCQRATIGSPRRSAATASTSNGPSSWRPRSRAPSRPASRPWSTSSSMGWRHRPLGPARPRTER